MELTIHHPVFWLIVLIGHCFGDYLLQPYKFAFYKKHNDFMGYMMCTAHCAIYKSSIIVPLTFLGYPLNPFHIILIFGTHFVIDKYPIIEKWVDFLAIRSWDYAYKTEDGGFNLSKKVEPLDTVVTSFGAIVYVVCDNTIHILSLVLIFCLI